MAPVPSASIERSKGTGEGPSSFPYRVPGQGGPIRFRDAVGFGAGDFYGGGNQVINASYVALFWTRFCGLNIQTAQGILGSAAFVSALAALCFGAFGDGLFRHRLGRRFGRRHLILAVSCPLILFGILLWVPGLPAWAYLAVFMIWIVTTQLFQTAYGALPNEMTEDYQDRTLLTTTRLFISTLSCTLIPLAASGVLALLGEGRALSYQVFGMGFTLLFCLAVFHTWRTTWELTPSQAGYGQDGQTAAGGNPEVHGRPALTWWRHLARMGREYLSTLRIATFRRHLAIYLLVQMSMDAFGGTFMFFVLFDWDRSATFGSLMLSSVFISLPLMPLFGKAVNTIGPKRLYTINFAGCLTGVAWLTASWLLAGHLKDPAWTIFTVLGCLFFFAFKSLCGFIPWSVFPLIADVDQIITGKNRSATFGGLQSCLRQICSGVVTTSIGLILAASGFDASRPSQPRGAQLTLAALLLGWFALNMSICWVISRRLDIDRRTDGILAAETSRLRAGGSKADVDPETRAVVEDLTGLPYSAVRSYEKG